jgi:hypothetical protein
MALNSNISESQHVLQKISREALLSDKSIIVGKRVKVPFPGIGNYVCKLEKYNRDADTYTLSHPEDNWSGDMLFDDVVKLIPKSWLAKEHIAHVNAISCAYLEALDTACCMSASSVSIANFTEPANFSKAMIAPDCKEWMDACDSEMATLERMKCWEIVDESTMPPDSELIDPKWVLKLKFENGKYVKHKGRVVAKGYLQKRTSDFSSFSPTASQVTLRVILALTAMVGFKSWDLDATCAFISAPLPKGQKLYLKPIEGYPLPKGKVLKLLKTIYGLIQAPLAFYLLCSKVYTKVGYTQLKSDECVFVRQEDNVRKRIEICKE